MSSQQEESLREFLDHLPQHHRARKEFSRLREVCYAAVGQLSGVSIRTPESLRQWLITVLKETE